MKSADKKCWEINRRRKLRKKGFYIHTNIVSKKWGEKTRKKFFPESHYIASFKRWKKIVW